MKFIREPGVPVDRRVLMAHRMIRLDDGHNVGVSLAGGGVPLVFFHGMALSRRVYAHLLSHLPQSGFLTVALDAPSHGDTDPLPQGAASFRDRAALLDRALDALGIERAVLVGHSMGGRNVVELAAARPNRVLCAVLINAGVGATFDHHTRNAATRVPTLVMALLRAGWDARCGLEYLSSADRARYRRLADHFRRLGVRAPAWIRRTALAIAHAEDSSPLLQRMRAAEIPTIVVHGVRDSVVPVASGVDAAQAAGAALYLLPNAYHSWLLPDPCLATDVMNRLLDAQLGEALRKASVDLGLPHEPTIDHLHAACLGSDARVLELLPAPDSVGTVVPFYGPLTHRVV
jgi:pimeloyl-ACP methyl ester carboxylesterase